MSKLPGRKGRDWIMVAGVGFMSVVALGGGAVRADEAAKAAEQTAPAKEVAKTDAKPQAAESAPKRAAKSAKAKTIPAPSRVNVGGVEWRTDYSEAYNAAKAAKRMLLVNFVPTTVSSQQQSIEKYIASSPSLQTKLNNVVAVRVPVNAEIVVNGKSQRLLSFASFSHLQGGPGFALIDLANEGQPYYGGTVNVLPYSSGKYYHFRSDYLSVILDLPPGTLTQRTMVWAVRVHPERPQSTYGMHHPTLANGATQQASYQANVGQQGHQNFETRFHSLSAAAGSGVSEVCAESWPNQNMIDSCLDCVASWRHSPGHWQGVSGRHRAFGYDIRRGRNGIWYGTGIFAD